MRAGNRSQPKMAIRIFDNEYAFLERCLNAHEQGLDQDDVRVLGFNVAEERERINSIRARIHAADALELAGFTDEE